MAVNSSEPRMTWGAIRNAQLIKVHLPEWRLRVYVPSDIELSNMTSSTNHNSTKTTTSPVIDPRVVATLQRLGAEVVLVAAPGGVLRRPPLNDLLNDLSADYVLMRQPQWRLSYREAAAVHDWIHAAESQDPDGAIVHCLHDCHEHAGRALVDGLWGFRRVAFRRRVTTAVSQLEKSAGVYESLLGKFIWPLVADAAYCHDNVSTRFGGPPARNSRPFPVERLCDDNFVGETFDENEEPVGRWDSWIRPLSCSPPKKIPPKRKTPQKAVPKPKGVKPKKRN